MYRFIGFFMALVITFTACCVPTFAATGGDSETPSNDDASWVEVLRAAGATASKEVLKVAYFDMVAKPLSGFSTTVATYDASAGVVGAGMSYFAYLIQQGNTPEQAVQIMDNSITTSEGNRSVTGDGAQYIENYYENGFLNGTGESLSEIGYVNRWICGADDLDPGLFMYQPFYECFKNLIKNNPEYYFKFTHTNNNTSPPYAQEYYIIATKKPFLGGVIDNRAFWGMDTVTTTLYADDWTTDFGKIGQETVGLVIYNYTSSPSYTNYFDWYVQTTSGNEFLARSEEDALNINLDSVISDYDNLTNPSGFASSITFNNARSISKFYAKGGVNWQHCIFHNVREAFPCFENLTDLKKGTNGLQTSAALLPTYNGNGITGTISDSQITQARDIINNYYYDGTPQSGNGNNNNNNNGGGSGSGWLDKLLDGLGSVGQALVKILGELLSIIGDAVTAIVEAISGVLDILNTGFIDMLSTVFPFLPQEFWTVVLLALSLGLLGLIIKFFRG